MNDLFVLAAHNTVFAFVIAMLVHGLTRIWRNPPLAHLLWLLVLLKLVAPPMVRIEWPVHWLPASSPSTAGAGTGDSPIQGTIPGSFQGSLDRPRAESRSRTSVHWPGIRTAAWLSVVSRDPSAMTGTLRSFWYRVRPLLLWCWIGGAFLHALMATTRIVRFNRCLRDTLPAPEWLQQLATQTARRIGLRRAPEVRYDSGIETPMLWCAGRRPIIVLPTCLPRQLDEQSLAMILAHELAHLRRRDHLVRVMELFVSTVYWWNPLVRLLRRQIHDAEELTCDAWVRWAFPDCAKSYATILLQTAELVSARQLGKSLLLASPFLRSFSLKARIEMILESRFVPHVSTRSRFGVAILALLILAPGVSVNPKVARATADDAIPSASGFPYKVPFELGQADLLDGDRITILEVHGTASTFKPDNLYMIKGTYALASHPRAGLHAYVTAREAGGGRSVTHQFQRITVERGKGSFTLFLVMSGPGWPHVSFYPADGGSAFGGCYFGTGDSVLKAGWGTRKTDQEATRATATASAEFADQSTAKTDRLKASEYRYAVRFEQGATRFMEGDNITILDVRGTAETFKPGNTYLIKGSYRLASHPRATLAAYVTAMDAANGTGVPHHLQSTIVGQQEGTFTLFLPMSCRGWPHLSFYPADGGGSFGGNYFGTGDWVLKRWWGSKDPE